MVVLVAGWVVSSVGRSTVVSVQQGVGGDQPAVTSGFGEGEVPAQDARVHDTHTLSAQRWLQLQAIDSAQSDHTWILIGVGL